MNFRKILSAFMSILIITIALFVPATAGAVSDNVIDTTKKGSITLYKYEMSDISQATSKGTGETSDAENVPESAKSFAGITFKVAKIAGLEDKYFQGKGIPLPTPSEASSMSALETPVSKTTDAKGMIKFTDLSLGVYLVQEVGPLNQVLKKTPDFVISIPTTDINSTRWMYDVTVYPKNETKYSDLTIHKSDYADNKSLADAQFMLERKDEKNAWVKVATELTTDSEGNVTVKDLPVNSFYRITETKTPSKYILDTTNNQRIVYIDTKGRVCDESKNPYNTNNNPILFEFTKNSKPAIDKFIDKSKGNNTNLVKETTFAHRSETDRNYYTIVVTTPNVELSKLKYFKVTDQINHTLQSPRVESVKEENSKVIEKGSTGYTTSVSADNLVTINFSTADNTVIKKNTKYYISISCFHSLTSTPILNKAELEYTSKTGTDETEKLTTDETKTITGAFEFMKVDESKNGLADAVFSIYSSENDAKNNTNPLSVATSETSGYSTTFKSGSDGKVRVIYLDFGDDVENGEKEYWISEIKAPNGYLLLAKPFKITVNRQSGSYEYTQLKIENVKQPSLPVTGGFVIAFLETLGALSLTIAGILLFMRKRKSTEK